MAETPAMFTPGRWFVYEPEWERHDGGKFVASILIGKCRGTDEQEEVPQEISSVNNDSLWFTGDKSEIVGSMFEHVEGDAKVYPEALANAHLIAAAPEMYEALKDAEFFFAHTGNHRALVGDNFAKPSVRYEQLQKTLAKVRAAIAKAEGRNA